MKLTKKEQKLLWLNRHNRKHNLSLTVGDYCRILHTTVLTLISKTGPSLEEKINQRIDEVIEKEYA